MLIFLFIIVKSDIMLYTEFLKFFFYKQLIST